MTRIQDISANFWQLSLKAIGNVVEGIHDIHQSIYVILLTIPGSDPFRPDFGCDFYQWIDKPVNLAVPNMVRSVIQGLRRWEPRIEVVRVVIDVKVDGSVYFRVEWTLANTVDIQITELLYGSNGEENTTVVQPSQVVLVAEQSTTSGGAFILTTEDGKKIVLL